MALLCVRVCVKLRHREQRTEAARRNVKWNQNMVVTLSVTKHIFYNMTNMILVQMFTRQCGG